MFETADKAPHNLYTGHDRQEQEPQIIELPRQRMAVVRTVGDPDRVMHLVVPALYSAVYRLAHDLRTAGRDFTVGHLHVRWPGDHRFPRYTWFGVWGLAIPLDTLSLPQKFPHISVEIETWEYGTIAELVHKGPAREEDLSVEHLRALISEKGYEIAGPLEEEYSSGPEPSIEKVIVRYQIRRPSLGKVPKPALQETLVISGAGSYRPVPSVPV